MAHQRSPELGRVTETPVYRRQNQTQISTDPQAQLTRPGPLRGQEVCSYPSYLSMASGPTSRARQQPQEEETDESEAGKTEGLLRSRKAVLPSEIRRRERSTEDPWRGRVDESHRQAREADDPARGGHRTRARLDKAEYTSSESRPREHDSAATHIQPRSAHAGPGISGTDTGDPQVPSRRNRQHLAHDPREVREGEDFSHRALQPDSQVSVALLRHSYMESATTPPTGRRIEL